MTIEPIETRALRWAATGSGVSAKAIFGVMTGNPPNDGYCYPHDGGDLSRCIKLLDLIPEWRIRLDEMASVGPEWAALVASWGELETMCRRDDKSIFKRMKAILDPIEKERPGLIKINSGMSIYAPGLARKGR